MGILERQRSIAPWLPAPDTNTASAFSPCQITGFFSVHNRPSNPAEKGSTGAGINLAQGVATTVSMRKTRKNVISIRLNGRVLAKPLVSARVVRKYLEGAEDQWRVQVDHRCVLPVGAGYGTSGAGAASLSLALNEALGGKLSRVEALRIAHVADVQSRTGLGTVASVSAGGLAVRVEPGAPGVGTVRKIVVPHRFRIVSGSFGPLSKPRVLSNNTLTARINSCAKGLVEILLARRDAASFMGLSQRFSSCLGLASKRLRRVMETLYERDIVTSMMMLGEGAFCIVPESASKEIARMFRRNGMFAIISKVGVRGARVL